MLTPSEASCTSGSVCWAPLELLSGPQRQSCLCRAGLSLQASPWPKVSFQCKRLALANKLGLVERASCRLVKKSLGATLLLVPYLFVGLYIAVASTNNNTLLRAFTLQDSYTSTSIVLYWNCSDHEHFQFAGVPLGFLQGLNEAASVRIRTPAAGSPCDCANSTGTRRLLALGLRRELSEGPKVRTIQGLYGPAQAFPLRIVFLACPASKATGEGCKSEKHCQPSQGSDRNGPAKLINFQQAVRPPAEAILLLVVTKC